MPQSASIQKPDGVLKIDFGSFSVSINSFVDISQFRNLNELTIRNTNLITFINGFFGQSLNLTNAKSLPISFISGSAIDTEINQKIIGTGSIKKINTGKLSLKAVNEYTGKTEILDGVLEITSGSLGNGFYSGNIENFSQFSIITPIQQTLSGIISGTGVISLSGDVIFTRNNTYTGQTSILAGGKLKISQETFSDLTTSGISNAGELTFAGTIDIRVPNSISGAGLVNKIETGKTFLAAANSYSGNTTISGGHLVFEKIASLYNGQQTDWTKNKIIVNSGAAIGIFVGGTGEFALAEISVLLTNLSTSISNNGLKSGSNIAFDTTNSSGGTFTLSSIISDSTGTGSGSVGLQKLGLNTLVVSGANTFTGQLHILNGIFSISEFNSESQNGPLGPGTEPIKIGSDTEGNLLYTGATASTNKKIFFENQGGRITISTLATTLTISNLISGPGQFKKYGAGKIVLDFANTHSGTLSIFEGSLLAKNSLSLGSTNSNLVIAPTATLELENNISITKNILPQGATTVGANVVNNSGDNAINGAILSTGQLDIYSVSGVLTINSSITGQVQNTNSVLRSNAAGRIDVYGKISGLADVYIGSNANTTVSLLNDSNDFTGKLQCTAGDCIVTSIGNNSTPSAVGASNLPIQLGQSTRTAAIKYIGSGQTTNRQIQIGRSTNVNSEVGGAIIKADGSGELIFSAANFNFQTNATAGVAVDRTLNLSGDSNGTISGIIRDNIVTAPATGTARVLLVKSGAGKWTLNGANTFTGTTTINAGYLLVANASALGAIATATTVNSGASLQISGGITLAAEPLTISGAGVATDGALANFSGTNSMSGAITLAANAQISSIAGALTISGAINGATRTLTLAGDGALTISGIITLTTGGIIFNGSGLKILTAVNSYTGASAINSGAVRVQNASALGTGAITVQNSAQLELAGAITFARPVTISGGGTGAEGAFVNRSGNNTMSGAITLAADSEVHSVAGTLTISGAISGATRTIFFGGAGTITLGAIITLTTGSLIKQDSGILNLANLNHSYTGQTNIAGGTLTRARTVGTITATGTFTPTTLSVAFSAVPAVGSTWKFFPADTVNTYSSVTLTGATGRTGTYNSSTSTLTIS